MAEIPVTIKLLAERSGSVETVLRGTQKQFEALAGYTTQLGRNATLATAALTAGLAGVGVATLRTAGQFEQLQAKLTSALGSSTLAAGAFASTLRFAAQTPFDVQSLVQATVTLESFGQRSQQVLPLAANLAAAFGKSAQESALTLGKALSGSLEGFESLRNTYGISTAQLARYGAQLTATGGISVRTAGDLAKARAALTQIIQTRFGDAVEKQSATLFGALSNLGDAVARLAGSLGTELVPAVTVVAKGVTATLESFEKLPPVFRSAVALSGAVALGIGFASTATLALATTALRATATVYALATALGRTGTVATVAAGQLALAGRAAGTIGAFGPAGAAISGLGRNLAAAQAGGTAAAQGFARIGTAIAGVVGWVRNAAVAVGAFLTGGFGAALVLIGTAAGAAALKIYNMNNAVEGLDRAQDKQNATMLDSQREWKAWAGDIEKATGSIAGFIANAGSTVEAIDRIGKALENADPTSLVAALEKMGITEESLTAELEAQGKKAAETRQQYQDLLEVRRVLEGQKGSFGLGVSNKSEDTAGAFDRVKKSLGGVAPSLENIQGPLERFKKAFENNAKTTGALEATKTKVTDVNGALEGAAQNAQAMGDYLRYASDTDNPAQLQKAIGEVDKQILSIGRHLAGQNIQLGDQAALRERLLTGTANERKAAGALLDLYKERASLVNKKGEAESRALDVEIKNIERGSQIAALKGEENLSRTRSLLAAKLAVVKQGSDEELQLRQKVHDIDQTLLSRQTTAASTALDAVLDRSKGRVEELKTSGAGGAQALANAYRSGVAQVQAFENANAALVAKSPELQKAIGAAMSELKNGARDAEAALPKERLDGMLEAITDFKNEATTLPEKLAAVERGAALITESLHRGAIANEDQRNRAIRERNALEREGDELHKQVRAEERRNASEMAGLQDSVLQGKLQILKAQADGGDKRAAQQAKTIEDDILRSKLEAINRTEQAERDSSLSSEEVARRKELRLQQLAQETTLAKLQAQEKETAATEKAVDAQLAAFGRLEQLKQNRVGGAASPLMSLEELGLQSTLAGFGSVAPSVATRLGGSLPRFDGRMPEGIGIDLFQRESARLSAMKAELDGSVIRKERDFDLSKTTHNTSHSSQTVNNWNVHLPTASKGAKAAEDLSAALQVEADRKNLTFGPGGPRGVK